MGTWLLGLILGFIPGFFHRAGAVGNRGAVGLVQDVWYSLEVLNDRGAQLLAAKTRGRVHYGIDEAPVFLARFAPRPADALAGKEPSQ